MLLQLYFLDEAFTLIYTNFYEICNLEAIILKQSFSLRERSVCHRMSEGLEIGEGGGK